MIKNFRDLDVYKKSYKCVLEIYQLIKKFPDDERFALTSQIKRAAYSIPLNIAEGHGKHSSEKEFKRFLLISLGSSDEMQVLIDLSFDLNYISNEEHEKLLKNYEEISRMLNGLMKNWK